MQSLKDRFPGQKFVFLVSIMADKDVDEMLALLAPLAERFVDVYKRQGSTTGLDALVVGCIVVYMYSFFDTLNLRAQLAAEKAPEDD